MAQSEQRRRHRKHTIRFTDDEFLAVQSRASSEGLTIAGLFRSFATGQAQPRQSRRDHAPGVVIADPKDMVRLLGSIGRIGNNVNQLARVSHAGAWPETSSLLEACADIRSMKHTLMRALGVQPDPDELKPKPQP